jgi:hypothetical protein
MIDISRMRQEAERRHQDVLNMIEDLSDVAGTDTSSNVTKL